MVTGSQVSVKWSVPNYSPQILTADGGVIAESSDGSAAAAFDAGGRSTGLSPLGEGSPYINWLEISVYSADPGASVASTTLGFLHLAPTFSALASGNQSHNGTAVKQEWFPQLASCHDPTLNPPVSCPGPKEALDDAVLALRRLVRGDCPACVNYVFSKLDATYSQQAFSQYLSKGAAFYDGTRSSLNMVRFQCGDAPAVSMVLCQFPPLQSVSDYLKGPPKIDAISQTPSRYGEMIVFFDPASVCRSLAGTPQGIFNEATIFHEGLHGFTGKYDDTLMSLFNLDYFTQGSIALSYYLENNVLGGGATACAN